MAAPPLIVSVFDASASLWIVSAFDALASLTIRARGIGIIFQYVAGLAV